MTERLTFNYGTDQQAIERQNLDFDTALRPTDQATRTPLAPRKLPIANGFDVPPTRVRSARYAAAPAHAGVAEA